MIKTLMLALLLFLVPQRFQIPARTGATASSGGHSFNVVQTTDCNIDGGSSTSVTCSFSATAAGDSLLVGCDTNNTSLGFSLTATAVPTPGNPTGYFNGVYVFSGVSTGTTSLTVTTATFKVGYCRIAEVTGLASSSVVDCSAGVSAATPSGGGATSITGSCTRANANDVLIGFVVATSSTFGAGTGYTAIGSTTSSGPFLEYQVFNATGSNNPGITWTGTGKGMGTAALELQ